MMKYYGIWFMMGLFLLLGCGHSSTSNVSVKKYKNIKLYSDVEYKQKVWEEKQKLYYVNKYTTKESFKDLVVDAEGNSYVLKPDKYGRSTKIVKYDSQWKKIWKIQMPCKEKLSIKALDIDDKYIYIVGNGEIIAPPKNGLSTVTGYRYVAKYDLNGNQIWLTKERKKNSILNGNLILKDMVVSPDNSLYVIGFQMFNDNGYIDKYNKDGKILWHKSFKEMKFYAIEIDEKKDLCIVGESSDAAIITKYNSDGSLLWMKRIPTKNSENINLFIDIDIDAYNNIYAVGHGYSQVSYIFKLSAEGKSFWKRKTSILAGRYDVGASIFCGVEKKIYLAGQALKPKKYNGYGKNLTIAMYDPNGKLLDNKRY